MDATGKWTLREAAIGRGNDIVGADEFGEPYDTLGHQFRVLDDVGGMTDEAGHEHLTLR